MATMIGCLPTQALAFSCDFRLRNARNASDCVWMETGLDWWARRKNGIMGKAGATNNLSDYKQIICNYIEYCQNKQAFNAKMSSSTQQHSNISETLQQRTWSNENTKRIASCDGEKNYISASSTLRRISTAADKLSKILYSVTGA